MKTHTLTIIGYHHSPLSQKFGIPRQPNLVKVKSHIRLIPPYDTPDAFLGMEQYSHLWILWQFHRNKIQTHFRPQVRPPRLGGNDKIGVFATRSMYRPSQIGLSVVTLDKVELIEGRVVLHILGADMADGTPILDIKPYLAFSDCVHDALSFEKPVVRQAIFTEDAKRQCHHHIKTGQLIEADTAIILDLIAQDPRPAYRQDEIGVICTMRYKGVDVDFCMNESGTLVIDQVRQVD